jgi:hypothetical protein
MPYPAWCLFTFSPSLPAFTELPAVEFTTSMPPTLLLLADLANQPGRAMDGRELQLPRPPPGPHGRGTPLTSTTVPAPGCLSAVWFYDSRLRSATTVVVAHERAGPTLQLHEGF